MAQAFDPREIDWNNWQNKTLTSNQERFLCFILFASAQDIQINETNPAALRESISDQGNSQIMVRITPFTAINEEFKNIFLTPGGRWQKMLGTFAKCKKRAASS